MLAHIVGGNGTLTVFANGRSYTAAKDHPNYGRIVKVLKEKPARKEDRKRQENRVVKLLDVPLAMAKMTKGIATIVNGVVHFNGKPLHDSLANRIITIMNAGLPFVPMLRFLENVMLNPSEKSRQQLYNFLEHRALPITEDGCFLGYKKVRDDYMDYHTGTTSNKVGEEPKMPRENVDPDSSRHCSTGYHVGTIDYANNQFYAGSGKIVICKVNPVDAVSVPTDHSFSKLRVCKYKVVAEYVNDLEEPIYSSVAGSYTPPQNAYDDVDLLDDEEVDAPKKKNKKVKQTNYHNVRDRSGRFVKTRH